MSKCNKSSNSGRPPLPNRSQKSPFLADNLHTILKSSRSGINKKNSPIISTPFKRNSIRRSLRNSIAKLFSNEENVSKEKTFVDNNNSTIDPEISAKVLLKENQFSLSDEEKKLRLKIIHQLEKLDALNKNVANTTSSDCCLDKIISKKKLECLVEEIQEIRQKKSSSKSSSDLSEHHRISITVLRLPLAWTKVEGLLGKYDDNRRFDVFCLLRVKSDVYTTSIYRDVGNKIHDVIFNDVFHFNVAGSGHDFSCKVEVYARKKSSKILGSSTLRRKFNRSTDVMGSLKLMSSSLERNKENCGPSNQEFQLLATGCVTFRDVTSSRLIFNLSMSEPRNQSLPLFGQFCCKSKVVNNFGHINDLPITGDNDVDEHGRLI